MVLARRDEPIQTQISERRDELDSSKSDIEDAICQKEKQVPEEQSYNSLST